jgi:hypothetical protein
VAPYGGMLGSELEATWPNMRCALREALEFGLYGVSALSMPTCGFTTAGVEVVDNDLCLRWFQLAAFLPAMHTMHHLEHLRRRSPFLFFSFANNLRALTVAPKGDQRQRQHLAKVVNPIRLALSASGPPRVKFRLIPADAEEGRR